MRWTHLQMGASRCNLKWLGEPHRGESGGRLAQRLERPVYTRKVVRSNRTLPTSNKPSCGAVVQSVRTPACHAVEGVSANSTEHGDSLSVQRITGLPSNSRGFNQVQLCSLVGSIPPQFWRSL